MVRVPWPRLEDYENDELTGGITSDLSFDEAMRVLLMARREWTTSEEARA
jgi:hypothetical protein